MAPLGRLLTRHHLGTIVLITVMSCSAFAAQVPTSQSLGDLARKSREEKEKRTAPKTTFNDDSLLPPPPTASAPLNSGVETPPYQVKPILKSWPSCAAAVAEFNSNPDAAHTDQHIDASLRGSTSPSRNAWTFSGTVTATNTLTLSLPEWSNMPDDPRLQIAWNSMLAALKTHEEGHVKIAVDSLRELDGATITGTGASESAAKEDAQRKFGQLMQAFNSAMQDEQNRYDALTNHGRKQSAAGGTDVSLICP
jgi:predicted secreted Zn-dependent protease